MFSLRVSQNKEPSRALNSDTKVTITGVLDCLKKIVGKGKKREREAAETKEKVGKVSHLPSKELDLQILELSASVAFKLSVNSTPH